MKLGIKYPVDIHLAGKKGAYLFAIWVVFYLLIVTTPRFSNIFSFFDGFIFPGISTHLACVSGDPVANARSLMLNWLLSVCYIFYVYWIVAKNPIRYHLAYSRNYRKRIGLTSSGRILKRPLIYRLLMSFLINSIWLGMTIFAFHRFTVDTSASCFTRLRDGVIYETVFIQGVIIFAFSILFAWKTANFYGRLLLLLKWLNKRRR